MTTILQWLWIITLIHVNVVLLYIWYIVVRYVLGQQKRMAQVMKEDQWGDLPVSQVRAARQAGKRHIIKPIQCPNCDTIAAVDEHNALWRDLEMGAESVKVTCHLCSKIFEFNPDEEE